MTDDLALDLARLDWLVQIVPNLSLRKDGTAKQYRVKKEGETIGEGATLRAAIDDAMRRTP